MADFYYYGVLRLFFAKLLSVPVILPKMTLVLENIGGEEHFKRKKFESLFRCYNINFSDESPSAPNIKISKFCKTNGNFL